MRWRWHSHLATFFLFFCEFTGLHAFGIDQSVFAISDDLVTWNVTDKPNLNDTPSNFIFETANSLLHRWPNTRYRNGHTIVPATIPTGTLLYHGTGKPETPKIPEWLSVDPEHSYLFCGFGPPPIANSTNRGINGTSEKGCWHLTFVTTRPLKLLYFDGSSAAKMSDGPLDSQDLITWGGIREDSVFKDRVRIGILCEWGKNYNLDGFVRMEMDFEVMLCDFTAGLDPVTFLNLTESSPRPRRPGEPSPAIVPQRIRVLEAGGWSNRFPGDDRIKVDYSRLISFYDQTLFPNLHLLRAGQERWDHRLKGINNAELDRLSVKLKEVFMEQGRESIIDWKTLLHVVTNRYADRLEFLQFLLENATSFDAGQQSTLWKAHRHVSGMLTPYILHDSVPKENLTRKDHDWAAPVFKYCATTHTQYLETSLHTDFTSSEKLLLSAVQGVSKEICRVLVLIWAEGTELLSTEPGGPDDNDIHVYDEESRRNLLVRWKTSVSDLMAWLDWSVWVRCRPECSREEMCYLPTWPYFVDRRPRPPRPDDPEPTHNTSVGEEIWKRPQPMCIRRLEPYNL